MVKKVTNKKMTQHKIGIFKDKCPKCGNEDVEYGFYELQDGQFKIFHAEALRIQLNTIRGGCCKRQDIFCSECETYFTIWAEKPSVWEIWGNSINHFAEDEV